MGPLIRLCLPRGIEPWFIPFRSPGATGGGEVQRPLSLQVPGPDRRARGRRLGPGHRAFEEKHNSRYRYSKLGGQTPLTPSSARGSRSASRRPRSPPASPAQARDGLLPLVRFIRSDRHLDLFGSGFSCPRGRVRVRGGHRRCGAATAARGARGRSGGRVPLPPPVRGLSGPGAANGVTDQLAQGDVMHLLALVT